MFRRCRSFARFIAAVISLCLRHGVRVFIYHANLVVISGSSEVIGTNDFCYEFSNEPASSLFEDEAGASNLLIDRMQW